MRVHFIANGSEKDPLFFSELLSNTVPISLRSPDRINFSKFVFHSHNNPSIPFSINAWITFLCLLNLIKVKSCHLFKEKRTDIVFVICNRMPVVQYYPKLLSILIILVIAIRNRSFVSQHSLSQILGPGGLINYFFKTSVFY